jgi:hypothetical protein
MNNTRPNNEAANRRPALTASVIANRIRRETWRAGCSITVLKIDDRDKAITISTGLMGRDVGDT